MYRPGLSRRLRAREGPSPRKTDPARRWGSISDVISSGSQLSLLLIALWGFVFTDAGQRLISELRTDVSEARGALTDLRNQRTLLEERRLELERQLSDRQLELSRAATGLARTEQQAAYAQLERDQASARLAATEVELERGRQELIRLASTLDLTVPTAKEVVCSNLSWALNIPSAYLDLEGLLPKMRWDEFRRGREKFKSWAQLEAAFKEWSKETIGSERSIPNIITDGADRAILSEIRSQSHWESFGPGVARKRLGDLVKDDPNSLHFGIESHQSRPAGTLASVERYNLWNQLSPIFSDNKLAGLNPSYAAWLNDVRANLNRYRGDFDVNLPRAIPEGHKYDKSVEDVAIQFRRLLRSADAVADQLRDKHCNGNKA